MCVCVWMSALASSGRDSFVSARLRSDTPWRRLFSTSNADARHLTGMCAVDSAHPAEHPLKWYTFERLNRASDVHLNPGMRHCRLFSHGFCHQLLDITTTEFRDILTNDELHAVTHLPAKIKLFSSSHDRTPLPVSWRNCRRMVLHFAFHQLSNRSHYLQV